MNHQIFLENSKVLSTIPHYYKRKIREALEIEKFTNNINQDDGLKLKDAWKPVVKIMKTNKSLNNETLSRQTPQKT